MSKRKTGQSTSRAAPPVPWFVLGFIAMVILNRVVGIPIAPKTWIALGTTFLLSMALAAMGIETDFRKLRAESLKPAAAGRGGLGLHLHFRARAGKAYRLFLRHDT